MSRSAFTKTRRAFMLLQSELTEAQVFYRQAESMQFGQHRAELLNSARRHIRNADRIRRLIDAMGAQP